MFEREQTELLEGCRRGDPEALRCLVDAHYEPLYRFLWRLTGSPDDAAELTQESFVRALGKLDSFDGRSRIPTWLHSIAINVWRDDRRRISRRERMVEELEQERSADAPEQEALRHLEGAEVRRAVGQLPEVQRLAIILFFYEGMSYQEIARICGRPIGTVGSWIHHGVRTLRQRLADPEPEITEEARPDGAVSNRAAEDPSRRLRPRQVLDGEDPR